MKRAWIGAAAAVVCVGMATGASAAVIYQQPSAWAGNGQGVGATWASHVNSTGDGFRAFDDFVLSSGGTVSGVSWRGVYVSVVGQTYLDASPSTASWEVAFYADAAGAPGALLASQTVNVSRTAIGAGVFNGANLTVYEFTASISDFAASAGTTYWFSPFSRSAGPYLPTFGWIHGTGGNSLSYQDELTNGIASNRSARTSDRAFTLVPEPASLALLGAGVAMVLARRRRK